MNDRGAAPRFKATNESRSRVLVEGGEVADTFWRRLRGLMGRRVLETGQGLWITPCNSVHTCGMRFPIDVLYLDAQGRVVGLEEAMPPWRMGHIRRGARSVLELPSGTIRATDTRVGDRIALTR
jgi:hypothetical protein